MVSLLMDAGLVVLTFLLPSSFLRSALFVFLVRILGSGFEEKPVQQSGYLSSTSR